MAKFTVNSEMESYLRKLESLGKSSNEIIKRSIYPAADLLTNEVRKNIKEIPIRKRGERGTSSQPVTGITGTQRQGLLDSLGITPMRTKNGVVELKIGFDGYNNQESENAKAKGWTTKRQANAMVARSVENGTSWLKAHPFIKPAVKATQKQINAIIEKELMEEIKKTGL